MLAEKVMIFFGIPTFCEASSYILILFFTNFITCNLHHVMISVEGYLNNFDWFTKFGNCYDLLKNVEFSYESAKI